MDYCAAFDCNANSSKNKVTCSWSKFPVETTLFKKSKLLCELDALILPINKFFLIFYFSM